MEWCPRVCAQMTMYKPGTLGNVVSWSMYNKIHRNNECSKLHLSLLGIILFTSPYTLLWYQILLNILTDNNYKKKKERTSSPTSNIHNITLKKTSYQWNFFIVQSFYNQNMNTDPSNYFDEPSYLVEGPQWGSPLLVICTVYCMSLFPLATWNI